MSHTEESLQNLLRDGTRATTDDVDQLVSGLGPHVAARALGPPPRKLSRMGWMAGGVLAIAAGALVVVWTTPPPEAVPLDAAWTAQDGLTVHTLAQGVEVSIDGSGTLGGTSRHPEVAWSRGSISVAVVPGAVDGLTVSTPEARVQITGTEFIVARDALGTHVTVARGSVDVTCGEASTQAVKAGAPPALCLPQTAGGLLGRAQALYDAQAAPTDITASLSAALEYQPSNALTVEILATRALTLQRTNDLDGAWAATMEALPLAKGFRQDDLNRLALSIATSREDCTGIATFLDTIPTEDALAVQARAVCATFEGPQ